MQEFNMEYYLPITINERRLHICHMEEQSSDKQLSSVFSFIINKESSVLRVFGIDTDDAKLISTEGYDNDVKLSDLKAKILYKESDIDTLPTYYINLYKGKKEESEKNGLASWGDFTNSDKHFRVEIDKTIMAAATESFVVVICYKDEKQNKEFAYAFKIHLCTKENLIEAAMDFGSEASQISVKSDGTNMKLIREFKKFHSQYSSKDDFWQGNPSDILYKSVFFLHKNPNKTEYAELPNKHKDKTHIQTLIPKDADQAAYTDLEILPNMKLIELIDLNNSQTFDIDIDFKDGNPHNTGNNTNLTNKTTREGTLRLILSNFMYCILENKRINNYIGNNRCLRLVLLMPNVYSQQKVYTIIKELYKDFKSITTDSKYSQYRGLEIQIISESDAAFVGTKKDKSVPKIDVPNGYFLIIDAGKGTTDFSILKQYDNFSKFDSVYRAGIPASGHILTYAFYESIRDFLNSNGITLNDKLLEAHQKNNRASLLKFINCVESFKTQYKEEQSNATYPSSTEQTLVRIVENLQEILSNNQKIPNSKEKVEVKITKLVDELRKAINLGIASSSGFKQFEQVLLTGRGFLFEKFKDEVKEMLKKNNWISDDNLIFSYSSDRAKSICLTGAFSTTEEIEINKNSELIGRPIFERRGKVDFFKKIKDKLSKTLNKSDENLDTEFFYHGISTNLQNPLVRIGCNETTPNLHNNEEKRLYFIGNGFIFQSKNGTIPFNEDYLNSEINELVMQTLFPFFKGSIPDKEIISTTKSTTVKQTQEAQKQEIDTPVHIEQGNIDA